MFEVRLTTQAEHAYIRLVPVVRNRVDRVLAQFEQGDFRHRNIRSLRGRYTGSLRYRLGDWRIIFSVDHANRLVWVEAITTRGRAYR